MSVVVARRLTVCVLAVLVAWCGSAQAAASTQVSGRVVEGSLPGAGRGATVVQAVELGTTRILGAARAKSDGAYRLGVPNGVVLVLATVVRRTAPPVIAVSEAIRVRKGRAVTLKVSLRHRKPTLPARKKRRGTAKRAGARAFAASADGPVVAVKPFTGTGPFPQLGRGLSWMLMTDLPSRIGRCGGQEVEWEHRDLLQKELDLQQRNRDLFDPSTVVSKHWISPTVFVQGTVSTSGNGAFSWDISLVDARTGTTIATEHGSAAADDAFTASGSIADRLVDQLCRKQYLVKLQINTTYASGPFYGNATVTADVTATAPAGEQQPTTFTGKANVTWSALQYGSNQPECTLTAAGQTGTFEVTIRRAGSDQLDVTWTGDASSNAHVHCDTPQGAVDNTAPIIQPFRNTAPTSFTLPASGGSQTISGTYTLNARHDENHGTITVTAQTP